MDNVTLVKITHHDLYKAIKNYLHNELQIDGKIDHDYINKLVEQVVERRVERMFADNATVERLIERKIAEVITKGESDLYRRTNKSFGVIVLDEIKRAVRDQVMSKLTVNVGLDGVKLDTTDKG